MSAVSCRQNIPELIARMPDGKAKDLAIKVSETKKTSLFSSFFASYDAMNEYRGDRNVYRKLSTVDGNDNFCRLPSPLVNGKLTVINLK